MINPLMMNEIPTTVHVHQQQIQSAEEPQAIFVGGLPQSCQDNHLREFAEQYGETVKATVKIDPTTGRSRGFGFIQFKDMASWQELMGVSPEFHEIHGKKIEVKACDPNATPSQGKGGNQKCLEPRAGAPSDDDLSCFCGALPQVCDDAMLQEYGEQFGQVEKASVKMDPATQRSRGFGFLKFVSMDGVRAICANYENNSLDEKWIDICQISYSNKGKGKGGLKEGRAAGAAVSKGGGGKKGFQGKGGGGKVQFLDSDGVMRTGTIVTPATQGFVAGKQGGAPKGGKGGKKGKAGDKGGYGAAGKSQQPRPTPYEQAW